jgi:broad specificity phosphatase PhoE
VPNATDTTEPPILLVRHGATEWSQSGQHTSFTDIPLLPEGEAGARALAPVLAGQEFVRVLSSPLLRARQTCELAGFGARMEICDDLHEWNYGDYEGITSPQIRERDPDWNLWRDGCPGGESPAQVTARVTRVIETCVSAGGPVICFAHGHILRALSGVWIGLGAAGGERLLLHPATISRLGHEHATRVIDLWNSPGL